MSKQKFNLDTTGILADKEVQAGFGKEIDQTLKDFLIEGYNPILVKLEKLYKDNPKLTKKDPRVQKIGEEIGHQLQNMGWSEERIESSLDPKTNLGGSGESMPTHLAFVRREIEQGKPIGGVVKELSERLTGQTKKDFPRIQFNLIDQEGKPYHLDGQENFSEAIEARVKKNGTDYIKEFKEALHLTDEQLKLMLCRFNQRGIEGAGMAIVTKAHGGGPRENNLYLNINAKGEVDSTQAVENKYTVQKPLMEEMILADGRSIISEVGDDNGNPVKVPVSVSTYKVDISKLQGNDTKGEAFIALPTQKTKESLSFEALDGDAIYAVPRVLKHKTENNKLLALDKELTDEQLVNFIRDGQIKKELSENNYNKLMSSITPKIIEKTIEIELKDLETKNPKLPNRDIASKLQQNIADILDKPKMKEDSSLKGYLNEYVEQKNPGFLTRISHYVHAAFKSISIAEYKDHKIEKKAAKINDSIEKYGIEKTVQRSKSDPTHYKG